MRARSVWLWTLVCSACFDPNPLDLATSSTGSQPSSSGSGSSAGSGKASGAEDGTTEGTANTGASEDSGASDETAGSADETAGSTDSGDTDDTTGGPSGGCAAEHRCVESAPMGWTGPLARFATDGVGAPPACVAPWGSVSVSGYVDLDAPEAECTCDCGPASGASCSGAAAASYSDLSCTMALGGGTLSTSCSSLGGAGTPWRIAVPLVDSGTCDPSSSESVSPVVSSTSRTLCPPPLPAAACLGDGRCLPADGTPLCIFADGDLECPAGSGYDERERVYTSVDDTRGCTPCTCGDAEGTCTATATVYTAGSCSGTPSQVAADGSCRPAPDPDSGRLTINAVSATCPETGGEPRGLAEGTDWVTICCTSD